MSTQRRSLSSVRDLRDIDQVLKERRNPPRPAFTTLYHKRADPTPVASPPLRLSVSSPRATSSVPRASSASRAQNATQQAKPLPRTPAPATNTEANSNFAMLVARDVSRQPQNTSELRRQRQEEQYRISINRRYNMIVDESDVIRGGEALCDAEEGEAVGADASGGGAPPTPRRLIRPVAKGGLRSDYYVPNRKHTMRELRQPTVLTRESVRRLAAERTTVSGGLTRENITAIVGFIGKASTSLGTVALTNKAFAAAVAAKMLEEDDTATSDEATRRLRAARSAVAAIPAAFYRAVLSPHASPPARVAEALLIVMAVVEAARGGTAAGPLDAAEAMAAFRAHVPDDDPLAFSAALIGLEPSLALTAEGSEQLRKRFPGLEERAAQVAIYNPHAGTLVSWVCAMLNTTHASA